MSVTKVPHGKRPATLGMNMLHQAESVVWRVGPLRMAICLRLILTALILTAPLWLQRDFWLRGDMEYYRSLGTLSDSGSYPFLQYWMEYPPVFPLLIVGLYRVLAVFQLEQQASFELAFQLLMSVVDLASLVLLHRIVRRVWSSRSAAAAALVYATSPLAIYFALGWFDALAVLFLLAGFSALLKKRLLLAGIIVGLGILVKFFPGALLLAAPVILSRREAGRFSLATVTTVAVVLAPLAVLRMDLLVASFASMVTRGPWETLPALLGGNYSWGLVSFDRFVADTASAPGGAPFSQLSLALQIGTGLLAVGGATLAWFKQPNMRRAAVVVSMCVVAFVVGNKGFSPQFAAWLVPVILLAFPNRRGLVYVLLLTACIVCYYPFVHRAMVAYYLQHVGSIDAVAMRIWPYVAIRTLILSVLLFQLIRAATSSARCYAMTSKPTFQHWRSVLSRDNVKSLIRSRRKRLVPGFAERLL